MNLKNHQKALLIALVMSAVASLTPVLRGFLLPLVYLNTHFHELFHALTALATGGTVESISVFSNGSGVTPIRGGMWTLISSAGYVGAAVLGACLIYVGRDSKHAQYALRVMSVMLGISLIMFVRGDAIGVASGVFWVAALWGLSLLKGANPMYALQFIAIQQCMSAVDSLYTLLKISATTEVSSDAQNMAEMTHLPAYFWAFVWCLVSLSLMAVTIKKAWKS